MTKARDLASGGFGLVLVKPSSVVGGTDNGKGTVTFTGVSSVSFNDVFSATYTNYLIVINAAVASGSVNNLFRLRVGGADATGSNYTFQTLVADSTSISGSRSTSTSWQAGSYGSSLNSLININIANPFLASPTTFHQQEGAGISLANMQYHSGTHSLSTSYTGFTIYPGSSTFTGTVSVYGYNK